MTCTKCGNEIQPTYQQDKGDWQRMWAEGKNGAEHVGECPGRAMPVNQTNEE